jgi:hypothetical protein
VRGERDRLLAELDALRARTDGAVARVVELERELEATKAGSRDGRR